MGFGLASSDDQINPKVLPRRLMEDEIAERFNKLGSAAFQAAFDKAGAQWLSRDCHRSQYGYPFRVGIELALENRHRSVTLRELHLLGRRRGRTACSWRWTRARAPPSRAAARCARNSTSWQT